MITITQICDGCGTTQEIHGQPRNTPLVPVSQLCAECVQVGTSIANPEYVITFYLPSEASYPDVRVYGPYTRSMANSQRQKLMRVHKDWIEQQISEGALVYISACRARPPDIPVEPVLVFSRWAKRGSR